MNVSDLQTGLCPPGITPLYTKTMRMTKFIDILLIVCCSAAILINCFRIIRLLFEPRFLKHPVFDFPQNRWHLVLVLACTNLVMLAAILLQMGYLKKA
jgi:hypothetical protein